MVRMADERGTTPHDYYRNVKGAWRLDPEALYRLQALCFWRECTAREEDVPRNRVVWDEHLSALAEAGSNGSAERVVDALPGAVRQRYGQALLAVDERAREELHAGAELPEPLPKPLTPRRIRAHEAGAQSRAGTSGGTRHGAGAPGAQKGRRSVPSSPIPARRTVPGLRHMAPRGAGNPISGHAHMTDAQLVVIYRSKQVDQMYLYVRQSEALTRVPEALLRRFGRPVESMTLEISPDRRLARAEAATVLARLEEDGYYLQMPPVADA